MAISEKIAALGEKVSSLIASSNEVTGESNTTLYSAVNSLLEGFGKISGVSVKSGTVTFNENTTTFEITHNLGKVPKFLIVYTENAGDIAIGNTMMTCMMYFGESEQYDSNGDELEGENSIYRIISKLSGGIAYTKNRNNAFLICEQEMIQEPEVLKVLPNGATFVKYTNATTAIFPEIVGKYYAPTEYRWVIIG